MKGLHAGPGEPLPGKGEVLPGRSQGALRKAVIIASQRVGGMGLDAGEQEILKGMVVDPGLDVVEVSYQAIGIPGAPALVAR